MNLSRSEGLKASSVVPRLPMRTGTRPNTTDCAPHSQLDQFPSPLLSNILLNRLSELSDIVFGPSMRAPAGTVGLHMMEDKCCDSDDAFLIGREIAHVHPGEDGSMHAILPEPWKTAAIEAGWAEHHPLAGAPTVSPDTVMIYAPRDTEEEMDVVVSLIQVCWKSAHRDFDTGSE